MYTLGTAAKAAGVSKSTIHRAIKRGTISAKAKGENGSYEIDPAELHRVFPPVSQHDTGNSSQNGSGERHATQDRNIRNDDIDQQIAVRLARAEGELEALKQIIELERRRADEFKAERDRWAGIAEASQRQITDLTAKNRSWWTFGRRA